MAPSALIDVDALAGRLATGDPPVLLDVRWTLAGGGSRPELYREGHLPGAVYLDLDAELADPPGEGGRHPLPSVQRLAAALRRCGVHPSSEVVVLDGGEGPPLAAARAWWVLRWAGHHDVRVLDGGHAAWVRAGHPVEAGEVVPEPAEDAVVHPGSMPVQDLDELAEQVARLGRPEGVLVDVRAPERFRGEIEPLDPVAGHVPGAVNRPVTTLVADDGRLLRGDALRQALGDLAEPGAGEITASCGSGVTAAVLVLALHEVGVDARLFPGSWSQWVRDPSRPVGTG
jgi:thiosulfate/3-mercaptopyruvate sulfurtransferase